MAKKLFTLSFEIAKKVLHAETPFETQIAFIWFEAVEAEIKRMK